MNKREASGGDDGGGGGGGSSGKPPGDDWWKTLFENNPQALIGGAVAAVLALLFLMSERDTREINWQEFRTKYLERGEVRFHVCSPLKNYLWNTFFIFYGWHFKPYSTAGVLRKGLRKSFWWPIYDVNSDDKTELPWSCLCTDMINFVYMFMSWLNCFQLLKFSNQFWFLFSLV